MAPTYPSAGKRCGEARKVQIRVLGEPLEDHAKGGCRLPRLARHFDGIDEVKEVVVIAVDDSVAHGHLVAPE
jgi:hypothetical protein